MSGSIPHSEPQETYSVEQVLYENVELRQPVSEERLVWLLDRLQRLEEQVQTLQAAVDEGWEWKGEYGRLKEQVHAADEFKAAMVRANQRQVDEITGLREQLEAVRDALLREASIAERYATPRENAIVTAWADMAGNLRQIAASIPASRQDDLGAPDGKRAVFDEPTVTPDVPGDSP